jgi:hypothetical protein
MNILYIWRDSLDRDRWIDGYSLIARPLPTHEDISRENTHMYICAQSGIRTKDPTVREAEDNKRLKHRKEYDER